MGFPKDNISLKKNLFCDQIALHLLCAILTMHTGSENYLFVV